MTILVACGLRREAAMIGRPGLAVLAGGGDPVRLERALEAAAGDATAVLSCGVAGALDPALRIGDVVIGAIRPAGPVPASTGPGTGPEHAVERAVERIRRDEALLDRLGLILPHARRGGIAGADAIVAGTAAKAALYARTGAIAVDMESHIAARVAARHGLPFAVLRTISDAAGDALPPAALLGMRPDGGIALGAILASLALDPAQLPALIRTGRHAGAAFTALRRALDALEAFGIGRLDLFQFALDME